MLCICKDHPNQVKHLNASKIWHTILKISLYATWILSKILAFQCHILCQVYNQTGWEIVKDQQKWEGGEKVLKFSANVLFPCIFCEGSVGEGFGSFAPRILTFISDFKDFWRCFDSLSVSVLLSSSLNNLKCILGNLKPFIVIIIVLFLISHS